MTPEQSNAARNALRESLVVARYSVPFTRGLAWKRIIESLAFKTPIDLSLIRFFDNQDRERFTIITGAVIDGALPGEDLRAAYAEFFDAPRA